MKGHLQSGPRVLLRPRAAAILGAEDLSSPPHPQHGTWKVTWPVGIHVLVVIGPERVARGRVSFQSPLTSPHLEPRTHPPS